MEHTATCASKNRVSRFAVLIADFCNKIGPQHSAAARRSSPLQWPEWVIRLMPYGVSLREPGDTGHSDQEQPGLRTNDGQSVVASGARVVLSPLDVCGASSSSKLAAIIARMTTRTNSACRRVLVFWKTDLR